MNVNKQKLKEYYFEYPGSRLRLRQLERAVKIPLPSVKRYTEELIKEGFLEIFEVSGVKFYQTKSDRQFFFEKKLYNLRKIWGSGLIDYFREEYDDPNIILFGSYADGEDVETSDIDLFLEISGKVKEFPKKFELSLNKPIQLFIHRKITDIPNKMLINSIMNGETLNGHVSIYPRKNLARLLSKQKSKTKKKKSR